MIDSYKFGCIVIDGTEYRSDVIILPGKVKPDWWRELGHSLTIKDLDDVFSHKPETLVVGTGASGMMKIPEATKKAIASEGMRLVIMKTGEAVTYFNERENEGKMAGAFHLTC